MAQRSCSHAFRPFSDRALYCYKCGAFKEAPAFAVPPTYPAPVYVPYVPPIYVPPNVPTWQPWPHTPFWYTTVSGSTSDNVTIDGSTSYTVLS